MDNTNFDQLSIQDKILLVEDMAVEVCSIEFYDHRIYLYALNSLFIEAYHNIETLEIENIRVARYNDLDKYLSRIVLYQLTKKPKSFPGAL